MATFFKRKHKSKTTYAVQVRRKGFRTVSKSFDTRTDAKKWARNMEAKLDRGDYSDYTEASKLTLGDLFTRYIRENKHKNKKQWRYEEYRKDQLLKDIIGDVNLLRFTTKHLSEFRDRRLKLVKASTFNKDYNFISVVITTAVNDWNIYIPHNPCKLMKRESEARPRNKIVEPEEITQLVEACALSENVYLKPMVQFSLETAVRQGELIKIKYNHVDWKNRLLTLQDTKNGEDRTIPLSQKAFLILSSLPRQFDGRLFPLTRHSLKGLWTRALKKTNIKNLRWHDLRRTAITMLFEEKGLDVPSVQLISGHKNPMVLLNTYTKLDPKKLLKKLG